jgi:hypothetical protein
MIAALTGEIDPEAASKHLHKFAPNVPEEAIKNVLLEVDRAKDRKQHVIYKELHKKKEVVAKKADEPEKQLTKIKTRDLKKDLSKILTSHSKVQEALKALTNPEAKRFFLTYFSSPTLRKGYDPMVMFCFFLNYVENRTGIKILDTLENQKEFVSTIDEDGSL